MLTYDGVLAYDPLGGSYAFSPIGFQGITCGGGNTENCRQTTSLKYKITIGNFRTAALWQFGGYRENNASNGAYQIQAGGDIPTWGKGLLSFDEIYSICQTIPWRHHLAREATTPMGSRYRRSCRKRSPPRSPTITR